MLPSAPYDSVGTPILTAVTEPDPYQVLAVELSSFQLHWAPSLRPEAGVVLNIAEDHLDWHATMDDEPSEIRRVDPESGAHVQVDTSRRRLRERFAELERKRRKTVARELRRLRTDHVTLSTDQDWLLVLGRHLGQSP